MSSTNYLGNAANVSLVICFLRSIVGKGWETLHQLSNLKILQTEENILDYIIIGTSYVFHLLLHESLVIQGGSNVLQNNAEIIWSEQSQFFSTSSNQWHETRVFQIQQDFDKVNNGCKVSIHVTTNSHTNTQVQQYIILTKIPDSQSSVNTLLKTKAFPTSN